MTDRSDSDATEDDAPHGLDALGLDVGAMVGSAFASDTTLDDPVEELPAMRPTLGSVAPSVPRTPPLDAPESPRVEPSDTSTAAPSPSRSGAMGASSDRIASLLAAGIDNSAPGAQRHASDEIVRPAPAAADGPSDRDTVELPRDERNAPLEGQEKETDDDASEGVGHSRFGELGKSVGDLVPASMRSRRAVLLGAGVLVLIVALVFVLTTNGSPQPTVVADQDETTAPAATPSVAAATADSAIPVKSATARCPAGSTKGDLATDGQMNTAWVCVTAGIPAGQVLTLDLGGLYMVSALGIVPGFNAVNPDGSDEWIRHRVVKLIDIYFYGAPGDNGAAQTPESLDTRGARNETVAKFRQPRLASQIKIMIRSTVQPTGNPQTRSTGSSNGGLGLGLATTGPTQAAAGTSMGDFAVSSISVYGHEAR